MEEGNAYAAFGIFDSELPPGTNLDLYLYRLLDPPAVRTAVWALASAPNRALWLPAVARMCARVFHPPSPHLPNRSNHRRASITHNRCTAAPPPSARGLVLGMTWVRMLTCWCPGPSPPAARRQSLSKFGQVRRTLY